MMISLIGKRVLLPHSQKVINPARKFYNQTAVPHEGQNGSHFEAKPVPPPIPNKCDWEIEPGELDFSNAAMIAKEQLMKNMKWCFEHQKALIGVKLEKLMVASLHAKMIVMGFEHDKIAVQKLMGVYTFVAHDNATRHLLFHRLQLQGSAKYRLERQMFACLENMSVMGRTDLVKSLHAQVNLLGLVDNDVMVGRLMSLYSKMAMDHETACLLFARLQRRELAAWNNLIFTFADWQPEKATSVFAELEKTDIVPSHLTFRALLASFANYNSSIEEAYAVIKKMLVWYNLQPDSTHFGCIISMLVRRGDMEGAIRVAGRLSGISNHICGAIFGECARLLTIDKGSAEKMLQILARDGGEYMIDHTVYMRLKDGGVEFPWYVKKRSPDAPAVSYTNV